MFLSSFQGLTGQLRNLPMCHPPRSLQTSASVALPCCPWPGCAKCRSSILGESAGPQGEAPTGTLYSSTERPHRTSASGEQTGNPEKLGNMERMNQGINWPSPTWGCTGHHAGHSHVGTSRTLGMTVERAVLAKDPIFEQSYFGSPAAPPEPMDFP